MELKTLVILLVLGLLVSVGVGALLRFVNISFYEGGRVFAILLLVTSAVLGWVVEFYIVPMFKGSGSMGITLGNVENGEVEHFYPGVDRPKLTDEIEDALYDSECGELTGGGGSVGEGPIIVGVDFQYTNQKKFFDEIRKVMDRNGIRYSHVIIHINHRKLSLE